MIKQRSLLDRELNELRDNIQQLASMVDNAIDQAMVSLQHRNTSLAQQVIAADRQINALRYEIEQKCLTVLATQQPAAIDLRTVIATIHIAVELERIGDHAASIADIVERLQTEPEIDSFHKLPKMAKRAHSMVQQSVGAFIKHDVELARAIMKRENKMDRNYESLFIETLQKLHNDPTCAERATYLLLSGRHLERIGDRATNIAERVMMMMTGEFVEFS